MNRKEEAIDLYEVAMERFQNNEQQYHTAMSAFVMCAQGLAQIEFDKQKFDTAGCYYQYKHIYSDNGALAYFKRIEASSPDSILPDIYSNMARIYVWIASLISMIFIWTAQERMHRFEEGYEVLKKGLKIAPKKIELLNAICTSYLADVCVKELS